MKTDTTGGFKVQAIFYLTFHQFEHATVFITLHTWNDFACTLKLLKIFNYEIILTQSNNNNILLSIHLRFVVFVECRWQRVGLWHVQLQRKKEKRFQGASKNVVARLLEIPESTLRKCFKKN